MKFYLKKASKQDIERTTVINTKAATQFFGVKVVKRDDEANLKIKYLPNGSKFETVKIVKKQDIRIFIKKDNLNVGDLMLFERLDENKFSLEYKKQDSEDYEILNKSLNRNYLITDSLPSSNNANRHNSTFVEHDSKIRNIPLNRILYGPPGTGKTDRTIEMSLEIVGQLTDNREDNRVNFRGLLNNRIFFVTMHPSFGYEDFVQGIKPITSNDKELIFEMKSGVFKRIVEKAKLVYQNDGEIEEKHIDNRDILKVAFFLSKFNNRNDKGANKYFGSQSNGEVFAKVGEIFAVNPNSIKNHRDKFDFLANDERKGWTPRNGSEDKLDNSISWPYNEIYDELKEKTFEEISEEIKTILEKARNSGNSEIIHKDNSNFVLILDEINRSNVSKAFGELITLIEEDKRLGGENEMIVTLPSGESFSLPPNLYIIGTMNTADKSIALVDIALRRRFQFIAVYPDCEVIEKHCSSNDKDAKKNFMEKINILLRKEKGVDFQIGHAYFISEKPLTTIINENILPLLTEFFRNDLEKVRELMNTAGREPDKDYYEKTGLLMCKE